MKYINDRVIKEANYIIETGYTIRELASIFDVSKSTVHKDLHERLLDIDIRNILILMSYAEMFYPITSNKNMTILCSLGFWNTWESTVHRLIRILKFCLK